MVGRRLAKNINLHLVNYQVKWHQKMLHFMKCFPHRLSQAHAGSICTSLQERDFQPFKYQCLEMAGGWPKYSAFMKCPKTLWLGGDPTKVLWAFGILWSEKMGENSHFCIRPAPDKQAKLSALWALLLWHLSLVLKVGRECPSLLWPQLAGITSTGLPALQLGKILASDSPIILQL